MENKDIAEIFRDIARILEIKGDNPSRVTHDDASNPATSNEAS